MRKLAAGNWKMNKTVEEAVELAEELKRGYAEQTAVDMVLCPPFTALKSVSDVVSESQIRFKAAFFEKKHHHHHHEFLWISIEFL